MQIENHKEEVPFAHYEQQVAAPAGTGKHGKCRRRKDFRYHVAAVRKEIDA